MIAQTIQLALAPVFVLVAIGNMMNLLSARLGRIVDRSRHLQERHTATSGPDHDAVVIEMRAIAQRIHLINRAIFVMVLSGLSIGVTVAVLFLEEMVAVRLQFVAAGLFLVAIGLLMWGLLLFLRETRVASAQLRIPKSLLELEREI
ncbi:MAG: hypothetical protein RL339_1923 [Pseudomonadota bacterium]|jgi:hypothetical protein